MYLHYKKLREFEDEIGFDFLIKKNIEIGKFLKFEPEIEYAVCCNNNCCYSPKNVCLSYSDWRSQEAECKKWIEENIRKFPDGEVAKKGYRPTRLEYYPSFHSDWNHLIEAIKRLKEMSIEVSIIVDDIFETWKMVSNSCFIWNKY
jgi:hypothetical protein